jgi:methylmalonyl-CoA/ethylmalonyl-CoA epimerase
VIPVFHHVGHATKSISRSQRVLEALGYEKETEVICDQEIGVLLQFWTSAQGPRIELVEPFGNNSPAVPILQKRSGAYHYAFEVDQLEFIDSPNFPIRLRAITKPQPAVAFAGRRVQFFTSPEGSILEFIEMASVSHGDPASHS